MPQIASLSKPVGSLMRPVPRVWTSASVAAAAAEIRDSGLPAVAVTEGFLFVAIVTQESLAEAQARGVGPEDSVSLAYNTQAVVLPPYAPGEKALELFSTKAVTAIPVVDDYGRLMGLVTPADLWPKRDRAPRPAAIGGMATPFGVYLTTGTLGAGATGWPLVVTGVLMFTVMTAASLIGDSVANELTRNPRIGDSIASVVALLLFALSFRLLPISGIHAAEHKVVHAIERGEELTVENVRRMPRVHPRCGTNFATGATIFLSIELSDKLIVDPYLRAMTALLCMFLFWRPIGSLVQYWVTTKEPNTEQIEMGIRSGQELLKKYASRSGGPRNLAWRIWNSGMIHVLAGSSATYGVLWLLSHAFHVDLGIL